VRIVLGIGNPGKRYENTRHNIGFSLLDEFARINKLTFYPSKSDYFFARGETEGSAFVLIKPSTYVNNSGMAAVQALDYFNITIEDFLVIVDDINLNTGTFRVRASGGDGGHNGLKSLLYHLQSIEFPRIRIGIGAGFPDGYMADYVLSKFHKAELELVKDTTDKVLMLMNEFIKGGTKQMLDFNSKLNL
jgi:peptidyl-tRNA hydrolase, PTH1 family